MSPEPLQMETALQALRELQKDSQGGVAAVIDSLAELAERLLMRGLCVRALIEVSSIYLREDWIVRRRREKTTSLPEYFQQILLSLGNDGVVAVAEMSMQCALRFADSLHQLAFSAEADEALPCNRQLLPFQLLPCLLYTSPSPRDQRGSRMPSSA